MSEVLGIDFGTTHISAAVVKDGLPTIVADEYGRTSMDSVMYISPSGEWIFGEEARNKMSPKYTIDNLRKSLFSDRNIIHLRKQGYHILDIFYKIFLKLKQNGERCLNKSIFKATIVLPERFSAKRKSLLTEAAKRAGLRITDIITDGMATMIDYAAQNRTSQRIWICDFGGGVVSATLGNIRGGMVERIDANIEFFFGGLDFNRDIVERLVYDFKKEYDVSLFEKKKAMWELYQAVEDARKNLSFNSTAEIYLPHLAMDNSGNNEIGICRNTNRNFLYNCTHGYWHLIGNMLQCMRAHGSVDTILLTGGLSKTPRLKQSISEAFPDTPCHILSIDEVQALGAAIYGNIYKSPASSIKTKASLKSLPNNNYYPQPNHWLDNWNTTEQSLANTNKATPIVETPKADKRTKPYKILVTATMSAGKSTFINALIGKAVSKAENLACTDKILSFVNNTTGMESYLKAASSQSVEFGGSLKDMKLIVKDSPGVNSSANQNHRKITLDEINKGDYDLLLYIVNATQIGVYDDSYHLDFVREHTKGKKIIFLLNKIDCLNTEDENLKDVIKRVENYVIKKGFSNSMLCPISAKAGFIATQKSGDQMEQLVWKRIFKELGVAEYYHKHFKGVEEFTSKDDLTELSGIKYVEKIIRNYY